MGSVSSLISGHGFHSKHCRASQYKLRKSSHLKKLNRYSDGLLRFGFSQDSGHGKSSSKMGKSEDFFYIKVSQKARGSHRPDYTALSSGDLGGQAGVDFGPSTPPKLMPFSNQLEMVSGVSGVGGWVGKAGERRGARRGGGGGLNAYISERLSDAERAGVLSHSREQAWTKEWARWSVP